MRSRFPLFFWTLRFLRTWEMFVLVPAEQFADWRNTRLLVSQGAATDATACRALLSAKHATLNL